MLPAAMPFTGADADRWLRAGLPRWVTSIALPSLWGLAFLVAVISDTTRCTPQDPSVCGPDSNFALWFAVLLATPVLLIWMPVIGCLAGVAFALAELRYDHVTGARWAFGLHGLLCALVAVRLVRGAAEQRRIAAAVSGGRRADVAGFAGLPDDAGHYLGTRRLAVAGGLVLAGIGFFAWYGHEVADEQAHLRRAVQVQARITAVSPNESIRVEARTPAAGAREYTIGVNYYTDTYPLHSSTPVLVDPQDPQWVRLVAEPGDSTGWQSAGAGSFLLAFFWLLHGWRLKRGLAALRSGAHPVLGVRVRPDDKGRALILPAAGSYPARRDERPIGRLAVFEAPSRPGTPSDTADHEAWGYEAWDDEADEDWDHESQEAFGRAWRDEDPSAAERFLPPELPEDAVLLGALHDRSFAILVTAGAVLLPSGRLRAGGEPHWRTDHPAGAGQTPADEPADTGRTRGVSFWRRLTGSGARDEPELFAGVAVDPASLRQPPDLPLTVRPRARIRATGLAMLLAAFVGYPAAVYLLRPELAGRLIGALVCASLAADGAARVLSYLRLSHHEFELSGLWQTHWVPWDRLHGVRRDGAVLAVAWQPDLVTEVGPFDDPAGERARQDGAGEQARQDWAEQVGATMLLQRQRALLGGLPGREASSRPNATWLVLGAMPRWCCSPSGDCEPSTGGRLHQRLDGRGRQVGRHPVAAGELAVVHLVALGLQRRDDPAAAALDRQHGVGLAVRDEDGRLAVPPARHHEAGREGQDAAEQLAVDQADRQRVGGAVGETGQRDPGRVHREMLEHPAQQPVQHRDVRTEPAADDVPAVVPGLRRQQQEPPTLSLLAQDRQHPLGTRGGAVQQHHQRQCGTARPGRHEQR